MKTLQRVAAALAALLVSACVYYEPVPMQNTFDQAWGAAIAGAQDAGVQVLSADRVTGVIRGSRPPMDVAITLRSRADGSVEVAINAKGSPAEEKELTSRILDSYNRRMGR